MPERFQAFTIRYHGKTNQLVSDVGVSLPFEPPQIPNPLPPAENFRAIWDTGATNSCITSNVVNALGLKPIGKITSHTANGPRECDQYLVNVYLPNKVGITMVRVTECTSLVGGADILIGMDIIGSGDFSVTHTDGKTTMSYILPSMKTIDYVAEANVANSVKSPVKHTSPPRQQVLARRKKDKANKKKGKKRK